jgi:SprT-like domain-contaning protein Spartan
MIHAFLFITKSNHERNEGKDGHGGDFIVKMNEINSRTGLRLSVYHSFHDEVDSCREHIWLCNGPCRFKEPYLGVLKRSKNSPPNPNTDYWYKKHLE